MWKLVTCCQPASLSDKGVHLKVIRPQKLIFSVAIKITIKQHKSTSFYVTPLLGHEQKLFPCDCLRVLGYSLFHSYEEDLSSPLLQHLIRCIFFFFLISQLGKCQTLGLRSYMWGHSQFLPRLLKKCWCQFFFFFFANQIWHMVWFRSHTHAGFSFCCTACLFFFFCVLFSCSAERV